MKSAVADLLTIDIIDDVPGPDPVLLTSRAAWHAARLAELKELGVPRGVRRATLRREAKQRPWLTPPTEAESGMLSL